MVVTILHICIISASLKEFVLRVCGCKLTKDFSELLTGKTKVLTSFFMKKNSEVEVLPVNGECYTYGSLYGLAYLFWIAMALPFGECEYRG